MPAKGKSPGVAVLLSLIPGLGHIYAGQTEKGIILFVVTGLAGVLMVIAAALQFAMPLLVAVTAPLYVIVVGPALVIYSMADSYRAATAANTRGETAGRAPVADVWGETTGRGAAANARGETASRATAGNGGWWMNLAEATLWGLLLVVVGLFLVLHAAFPQVIRFGLVWPLLILVVGVAVLVRASGHGFSGGTRR